MLGTFGLTGKCGDMRKSQMKFARVPVGATRTVAIIERTIFTTGLWPRLLHWPGDLFQYFTDWRVLPSRPTSRDSSIQQAAFEPLPGRQHFPLPLLESWR